jgi:hypothetical protein
LLAHSSALPNRIDKLAGPEVGTYDAPAMRTEKTNSPGSCVERSTISILRIPPS